jgi:hypothetical protein
MEPLDKSKVGAIDRQTRNNSKLLIYLDYFKIVTEYFTTLKGKVPSRIERFAWLGIRRDESGRKLDAESGS